MQVQVVITDFSYFYDINLHIQEGVINPPDEIYSYMKVVINL